MGRMRFGAGRPVRAQAMIAGLGLLVFGSTLPILVHGVAGFLLGLPFQAAGSIAYATAALALVVPRSPSLHVAVGPRRRLRAAVSVAVRRAHGPMFVRTSALWLILPYVASAKCGMNPWMVGALLTAGASANVLALPLIAAIARRWGRIAPAAIGAGLVVIATAILHLSSAPAAWVAAILMGAGGGLAMPMFTALAAEVAPGVGFGATLMRVRSSADFALVCAPAVIGILLGHGALGLALALSIFVVILCLGAAFATTTVAAQPRRATQQAVA